MDEMHSPKELYIRLSKRRKFDVYEQSNSTRPKGSTSTAVMDLPPITYIADASEKSNKNITHQNDFDDLKTKSPLDKSVLETSGNDVLNCNLIWAPKYMSCSDFEILDQSLYKLEDHFLRLRMRINNSRIVYIESRVKAMFKSSPRVLIWQLPLLPVGDWNRAYVEEQGSEAVLDRVCDEELPQISSFSFTQTFDISSTSIRGCSRCDVQHNRLSHHRLGKNTYVASHPELGLVIAKFDRFASKVNSERLTKEVEVYNEIKEFGSDIAPKFLGLLTEEGRKIGFLLEKVEGRAASWDEPSSDRRACADVLSRLHGMDITHNDAHEGNFIITNDNRVFVIDFDRAMFGNEEHEIKQDTLYYALRGTRHGARRLVTLD